jgi:phage tail-like protein
MAKDVIIKGGQRQLFPKHQFLVMVDNGWSAAFQKCSELSNELAKIEYWEGGSLIPWKVPGRMTVADLTLERGTSQSLKFYNWMLQTANVSGLLNSGYTRGSGDLTPNYMKDLKIFQLDRDGSMSSAPRIWRIKNAWVQKFVAGDWDNTADEVVMETLTLTFDYFEKER